ncbi:glycosidase [Syntrophothermus lipocalidus]|uniref:Glycosidase-related protein n=1 Tax=Syntrophothermus lipocalidus (strain DSM 12680 / TGB-C1) TaxID=643648 RepID=D7CP95_SYNLT|nr:glycosidase [Syntrophothermus lipocalidus]ADI02530.1 glycosidase-related protein [Syntrophothermus lipocalidus DSM 12680]
MSSEQSAILEALFDQSIEEAAKQVQTMQDVDLIIGIPFYNEKEVLPEVLALVQKGLQDIEPLRAALLLCVGDPAGAEVLEVINQAGLNVPFCGFLMKPGINGRGSSIRAIIEIANLLTADLVILAADLKQEGLRGFQPDWIRRLLTPIREEHDLAVGNFERHHFEDVIGGLFAAPLLETYYGYRFQDPLSGVYAMSHDLVENYAIEIKFWTDITQGYGIDPWLVTRAIIWNKKICEVKLGAKLAAASLEKVNYVFKETAASLFTCLKKDEDYWTARPSSIARTPDISGCEYRDTPYAASFSLRDLVLTFKRSFNHYNVLYRKTLPQEVYNVLEKIVYTPTRDFNHTDPVCSFNANIWAQLVNRFLIHYWFDNGIQRDDILNALTFAFDGRLACFVSELTEIEESFGKTAVPVSLPTFMKAAANALKTQQSDEFRELKEDFTKTWLEKAQEIKPPLTPTYYLEFIPGMPVILPKRIEGRGGRVVWTEGVFNRLQNKYQDAFNRFITSGLGLAQDADPGTIVRALRDFMYELEIVLERMIPGDLYAEEGAEAVVQGIFGLMPIPKMFSIKTDVFKEMLLRFPPLNVIIPAGFKTARELIDNMDARDATSLANLMENRKYVDRALLWILDNITPEDMAEVDIKPIVLGSKVLGGTVRQGSISDINKITTRITVNPLSKGLGGEFPRLRYCLHILRHIMIAQNYSLLWKTYAREKKNLGEKIRNSLIGRYQTDAFSAHNIFENSHHRALVNMLRELAQKLCTQDQLDNARALELMAESYGLSQILDDGTFLPCSAWTWASYSYKGGKGIPTPLSSHVEEKWFNHDLLEDIYSELGYDVQDIMQLTVQLIGEGKASENLLQALVGGIPKDVIVVPQEMADYPPAKPLVRYEGNPILSPIKDHPWESKYVLNAGTFRLKDKVYILYRAYGDDEVSRIGLAISEGYNILERLPEPVYFPADAKEKKGCEDPRVVVIDNELYMVYTAYDGQIAQIAAASISLDDFLNRRFDRWKRIGLAFEDIWNKDAIIFPEKINNKYVIYHRIEPSVWVSYMDELAFPVPKEKHAIIFGPRSGRMWDSLKIGAGTQPIKTRYGWLMIYHGVDRNRVYRLGVILVDHNNPARVLYRSPNPILSPETEYEIGKPGESWVPNVVFTCGAVPVEDKPVLGAEDEILVYYGAADTHVCVASGKVGDLIPEPVRKSITCSVV